jgi:hypothetical protein
MHETCTATATRDPTITTASASAVATHRGEKRRNYRHRVAAERPLA